MLSYSRTVFVLVSVVLLGFVVSVLAATLCVSILVFVFVVAAVAGVVASENIVQIVEFDHSGRRNGFNGVVLNGAKTRWEHGCQMFFNTQQLSK